MGQGRNNLRVAILAGTLGRSAGGVAEAVRGTARALAAQEALTVGVFGGVEPTGEALGEEWAPVCPETFRNAGPASFGYRPGLVKALMSGDYDVLHVAGLWMYQSCAALAWSRRTGGKRLVAPHGMLEPWALNNSRLKKQIAWRVFEGANVRGASCIHALNMAEAGAVRALGLRNPICVIPNGVCSPPAEPPKSAPWARTVAAGKKVVVHLGRFHRKKNLLSLIQAWGKIQRRCRPSAAEWLLVLAGWDQEGYAAQVLGAAREAHVDDSVSVLGPMHGDQKHAFLSHASAFVLPSLSEGLPVTVLEAWSYALPVLMTPECNLPFGFDAGAAIPITTQSDGIAEGLLRLFSMSDSERSEMGCRGRNLAEKQFSWDIVAAEMRAVYEWLLAGGTPPDRVLLD